MAAVTLSPATPNVTLSGFTSAYGTIGSYFINTYPFGVPGTTTVEAAVFGTASTNFNILNTGTILSAGTSQFDAGIVLGGVGAVKNTGTIIAPSGIFVLGYHKNGAYAGNFGTIIATNGDGIDMFGADGVNNSGLIIAADSGIIDRGGLVENFGTIISGGVGIDQFINSTAINNGIIIATASSTGVVAYSHFTNSSTGTITAGGTYGNGIFGSNFADIYNQGQIHAHFGVFLDTEAGFYNSGTVTSSHIGVYHVGNLDLYADGPCYITNYAGGVIGGKDFGILIRTGDANVYNYGLISGATAVADLGIILNTGTIKGQDLGLFLYAGSLLNRGTITGNTGILSKQNSHLGYLTGRTVTNQGLVTGQAGIDSAGGTITNAGTIQARSSTGIELTAAGQVNNGVYVTSTLTNAGTLIGTIIAAGAGISLDHGGTVTNAGTITSGAADGVDLSAGSALYNTDAVTYRYSGRYRISTNRFGTITGARYGVSLSGAGYIYNNGGSISGTSAAIYMRGVSAASTAAGQYTYLYNRGTITGTKYGILSRYGTIGIATYNGSKITGQTAILAADAYISLATGYVGGGSAGIILTQGGTIRTSAIIGARGPGSDAIFLGAAGGTVINGGDISGGYGVVLAGAGYLSNSGVIEGFTIGADLKSGGTIINQNRIDGYSGAGAIYLKNGTVVNQSHAYINGAVIFGAGPNRLILDPGSVIQGYYGAHNIRTAPTVDLNGGTLELAAATATTIGTVFAFDEGGAAAITIDQSAIWTFAAGQVFAASAPITNNGTILQQSGPGATLAAAITGQGDIDLQSGTITLAGPVGSHQRVDFLTPGAGDLALADPAQFAARIQNFALNETIDLTGISLSDVQGLTFSGGVLTITESQGSLTLTFSNPGHFRNDTFAAFADGPGTGITLTPAPAAAPAKLQNHAGWLSLNPTPATPSAAALVTLQT